MLAVPVDRLAEPVLERALRLPAEPTQLRRVQGVAAIVAGPVLDAAEQRRIGTRQLEDARGDLAVLSLVATADVVGLARSALAKDELDAGAVILHVQPVAHLATVAVERQRLSVERVRDEERDQLLRILAGAVGVRPAGDRRVHAEGADVRGDVEIPGGLRDAVGAGRPQRVVLLRRAARLEVAVDLVRRDLDEANAASANLLEQHLRPEELGAAEIRRPEDRAVDVRLGGEVDDRVAAACGALDVFRYRDVALHELELAERQVRLVPGVGQLVEDDDVLTAPQQPLDEVRADEAGAAGDEHAHGYERGSVSVATRAGGPGFFATTR